MNETSKRLQKILSEHGIASRRKAEVLISEGRVKVNGRTAKLGESATASDTILVDNKPLRKNVSFVYYAFHKPVGYIVSAEQQGEEKIIFDLIKTRERVFPVGRLDKDSEGLLLLTNDGDFAQMVSHPKYHKTKVYEVTLDRPVKHGDLNKIEKGIILSDDTGEKYSTAGIQGKLTQNPKKVLVTLVLGKYHVIRKMFGHFGYAVQKLKRVSIGKVKLGSLKAGEIRELTKDEQDDLRGS